MPRPRPNAWCGAATGRIRPRRTSRTTRSSSTCWPYGSRTRRPATASWCRTRRPSTASPRRRNLPPPAGYLQGGEPAPDLIRGRPAKPAGWGYPCSVGAASTPPRALRARPSPSRGGLAVRPRPGRHQRPAVELAALGFGQALAQENLLRRLERRQHVGAIAQDVGGIDARAGSQHHVAHHFLAIGAVGHADGRRLHDFGAPHQRAVDLERRDVDPAADDQLRLAAGEMEETVRIEKPDIAGLRASARIDPDGAVLGEIAVFVVGKAADLHRTDLARRQPPPARIDDGEIVIGERPADRAVAPRLPGGGGDPAGLARAVALRDRHAETLLETPPFLDQQRRRA